MHFAKFLKLSRRSQSLLMLSAVLLFNGALNDVRAATEPNSAGVEKHSGLPCRGIDIEQAIVDGLVFADGRGLPPGSGASTEGEVIFKQRCQSCHGQRGMGATAVELVGEHKSLTESYPVKAVGSYWFAAPTLLSYIQQAMPPQNEELDEPRLANDESYAVVAYILSLNGLWPDGASLDAAKLASIDMPNRSGFNDSALAREAKSHQIDSACTK